MDPRAVTEVAEGTRARQRFGSGGVVSMPAAARLDTPAGWRALRVLPSPVHPAVQALSRMAQANIAFGVWIVLLSAAPLLFERHPFRHAEAYVALGTLLGGGCLLVAAALAARVFDSRHAIAAPLLLTLGGSAVVAVAFLARLATVRSPADEFIGTLFLITVSVGASAGCALRTLHDAGPAVWSRVERVAAGHEVRDIAGAGIRGVLLLLLPIFLGAVSIPGRHG